MKMQQSAFAIIQSVMKMNNEDNLLFVGQIAEAASLLMIGALLWLFQPEIEEALFSDKNYLDVKTIAVMLIVIPL